MSGAPNVLAWLESTALATWTRESPSIWAYPTVLTLHTLGLAVVVGSSAVADLRLIGLASQIAIAQLGAILRLTWWAFALNAATGVLLFAADATAKAKQPVLYVKLLLVGLAIWNTVSIGRLVKGPGAEREPAVSAHGRRLAALSLLLWTGAIVAGRLMAYL